MKRTQEQRTREMRARLLAATVECLADQGYTRTTLARVTDLAGTSVGAQQHHFPTKALLVTSAVTYLAEVRIEEIHERLEALDGTPGEKLGAALDLTWETLMGRLNLATRELWTAARTDPTLAEALVPAERRTGRALRALYLDVLEDSAEARAALALSIDALRGLAMRAVLLDAAETERRWRSHRERVLTMLGPHVPQAII